MNDGRPGRDEERKLAEACLRGDAAALRSFLELYASSIRAGAASALRGIGADLNVSLDECVSVAFVRLVSGSPGDDHGAPRGGDDAAGRSGRPRKAGLRNWLAGQDCDLGAYVCCVGRIAALNEIREEIRRRGRASELPDDPAGSSAPDDAVTEADEMRAGLFECIEKLPDPRARDVVRMWFGIAERPASAPRAPATHDGRDADDRASAAFLATALGLTAENVRTIKSRALKALRKCLERKGVR